MVLCSEDTASRKAPDPSNCSWEFLTWQAAHQSIEVKLWLHRCPASRRATLQEDQPPRQNPSGNHRQCGQECRLFSPPHPSYLGHLPSHDSDSQRFSLKLFHISRTINLKDAQINTPTYLISSHGGDSSWFRRRHRIRGAYHRAACQTHNWRCQLLQGGA